MATMIWGEEIRLKKSVFWLRVSFSQLLSRAEEGKQDFAGWAGGAWRHLIWFALAGKLRGPFADQ
jgi:hypothetical protein